eukprot:8826900-Karenia_brevis.AAC.1
MRPDTVVSALQTAGLHPRLVAAMLEEMRDLKCYPELAGVQLDEPIAFNKCARQGGVESAFQWNAVMFMCFSQLVPVWLDRGFGVVLGTR